MKNSLARMKLVKLRICLNEATIMQIWELFKNNSNLITIFVNLYTTYPFLSYIMIFQTSILCTLKYFFKEINMQNS
jgi:hypothetical protein